jgi:signal transduction histidine kinase
MAVVITTVVVIVLAVLQYNWSNEVSEATGVRLADTLQLSMINWHQDLLRNFSEVAVTMRVDPESDARADLSQYVKRFAEWRTVARYPDFVSNVYFLDSSPSGRAETLRLNPTTRQIQPVEWPSQFPEPAALQASLQRPLDAQEAESEDRSEAARRLNPRFLGDAVRGWRFEPSIPALLHPIALDGAVPSENDWIVIELNDSVIREKILPDLAHRYFQGTDGLDYQVAVVAGGDGRRKVIYSSDSGFGEDAVVDADGRMDIFGRTEADAPGPIQVFFKTSQQRDASVSASISWFPLLGEEPVGGDWQLIVRHSRGGPLGAFVADMHRRDLAVSFGALLLLVISMAMLIVTSSRAHRLATLQMDFVTAVSHELRTPLTVISSAADNIVQGVVHGKDQVAQYGSVIGSQVRQLSALVEQVLLFAASNKGQQRFSLRPLQVSDIVDATLASTAGLIEAAHFTVERDVAPDLPPVMGDLVALTQCLQNLITNALKYARDGRWIGIRAHVAEHGAGRREIQVSISDHGAGIDAADLPHIFEPFYRTASTAGAQIHGTGLGLTLAKRIADAMKGQLTVTSQPGRGSTFTVHLPIAEPQS